MTIVICALISATLLILLLAAVHACGKVAMELADLKLEHAKGDAATQVALREGLFAVDLAESQLSIARMQIAGLKERQRSLEATCRTLRADLRHSEENLGDLIANLSEDELTRVVDRAAMFERVLDRVTGHVADHPGTAPTATT